MADFGVGVPDGAEKNDGLKTVIISLPSPSTKLLIQKLRRNREIIAGPGLCSPGDAATEYQERWHRRRGYNGKIFRSC